MSFIFQRLEIPDVILIESKVFKDERGVFNEIYKHSEFVGFGINERFIQDNHSTSKKGVLRGLHCQKNPKAQAKITSCIRGKIFDIAVDIRRGSPTYGKWIGVILSSENKKQLYIPEGFLHGFCVLSDNAEFIYKCSEEYSPENEQGVIWNDPDINIDWPIKNPIIIGRDNNYPLLKDLNNNFLYEK